MAVIRQRTEVFNKPVGVVRADAGAESIGRAISQAAGTMANFAFREAANAAEKKGIDVALAAEEKRLRTFDPITGRPEAYKAPQGFGRIAADAYQRVIDKRFEDSINTEMRLKAQEIALKYQFAPEAYDEAMSDYIGQMSQNSGGKYEAYIESTGAKYLALTKLNIQEKVVARARANASSQLSLSISNNQEEARSAAAAGDFESAVAIKGKNVGAAGDGIASVLPNFNTGDDQRVANGYDKAIALGGIDYLMSKTRTSHDRNQLILYLRSNGDRGIALDEAEAKKLLEFIDPSEKASIVNYASSVASDYNAVEADIDYQFKKEAARTAREEIVKFGDNLNTHSNLSAGLAFESFQLDDPLLINGAFGAAALRINEEKAKLNEQFIKGNITDAVRRSSLNELKENILEPFLLAAAAEGNIESLKAALSNPYQSRDMLTKKQNVFIDALHSSEILDTDEIKAFGRTTLEASEDSLKIKKQNLELELSLRDEISSLIDGGISDQEFNKASSKIRDNVAVLGVSTVETLIGSMRKARASERVDAFSITASSAQLSNLHLYVNTKGQRKEGMLDATIQVGNSILEEIEDSDVKEVLSGIDSVRVKVLEDERVKEEQLEKVNIASNILSGGGNSNLKDHREMTDEILAKNNVPVEQYMSWSEQQKALFLPVMASAVSQKLVTGLKSIASGQQTANANAFLSIYSALPKSAFGDSISEKEQAFLTDVINISRDSDEPISIIATTLRERQLSRDAGLNMSAQLKNTTLKQEAMKVANNDVIIAAELESLLEYHLLNFNTLGDAIEKVNAVLEEKYSKSNYIADPRLPKGDLTRSRYSLKQKFKGDDEARLEFVRVINKKLPRDVNIGGKTMSFTLTPYMLPTASLVKLVPIVSGDEVFYSAYFVDENNELRPLIYEADANGNPQEGGNLYNPTFGDDDLAEYRAKKEAELNAKLQKEHAEQQQRFETRQRIQELGPRVPATRSGN